MNREQLEALRSQAERLCGETYQQVVNATTEWHKFQGEFRAYDALLLNWPETPTEDKTLDSFDTKTLERSTVKESILKPKRGRKKRVTNV